MDADLAGQGSWEVRKRAGLAGFRVLLTKNPSKIVFFRARRIAVREIIPTVRRISLKRLNGLDVVLIPNRVHSVRLMKRRESSLLCRACEWV
jgi:hypothetical protein